MRIVSGAYRGRRLTPLGKGDAAAHLRPTSDRVRESLFSMLTHQGVIDGAYVLDLFAGTGALGIEALSRGAEHVRFVENGRTALRLIEENIRLIGCADRVQVMKVDARRMPLCADRPADLVFLDPPYGKGLGDAALRSADAAGWIEPGATIVWEERDAVPEMNGFDRRAQRNFGGTTVTLLEKSA